MILQFSLDNTISRLFWCERQVYFMETVLIGAANWKKNAAIICYFSQETFCSQKVAEVWRHLLRRFSKFCSSRLSPLSIQNSRSLRSNTTKHIFGKWGRSKNTSRTVVAINQKPGLVVPTCDRVSIGPITFSIGETCAKSAGWKIRIQHQNECTDYFFFFADLPPSSIGQ